MQQPDESPDPTKTRIRVVRRIGTVILIATGLVWIGQGTGLVPGSSMSGDPFWAFAGAICVGAGLLVGWLAFRPDTRIP